jgi:hypothetical protein
MGTIGSVWIKGKADKYCVKLELCCIKVYGRAIADDDHMNETQSAG